jgi:hypothetical protein
MERRTETVLMTVAILAVAVAGIVVYMASTPPMVDLTGFYTLSANPGLSINASSWERSATVGQNLTAILQLSPQWPVIVKNLSITTPGFSILSLNSSLPLHLDQNVTLAVVYRSNQSYSGSILLLVSCLNASNIAEKILVPDVVADTTSKTVTMVSVFNAGDVPLTNSTAYLIRSDGLVVNSTPLHSEGLLPGKISYFYIDMSYADATLIEIYRVHVVTLTGAKATSRVFALTCNC